MSKLYFRVTPVNRYDIPALESWLEDMARRGLFLKKFRPLFCTFVKGTPRPTRYRVEPHKRILDEDLPQTMLELYRDFGWDYVDEISNSMLIFSTQDLAAPELHSDLELQGEQWNKLRRSALLSCWMNVILTLALLALFLYAEFGSGSPVLALATTTAPVLGLFALCSFLFLLPDSFTDLRHLTAITRQLEAGIPLDHRTVYPKRRPQTVIAFLAPAVLLTLMIAADWILPLAGGQMEPLDRLDSFTPLSLAALEGEEFQSDTRVSPEYQSSQSQVLPRSETRYVDYGNFCRRERHLLCPNQWQVVQTGVQDLLDGIWVRMEIMWYDLPGSLLAVPLAREQLDAAMELDDGIWWTSQQPGPWTTDYLPGTGTDFLAVARRTGTPFQAAAAASGDKVVVVRYTGHGELADHLDEIAAMVRS